MVVVSRVQELIERTVQGMGYELVELEFAGGGLLRVYIDRLEADPIRRESLRGRIEESNRTQRAMDSVADAGEETG